MSQVTLQILRTTQTGLNARSRWESYEVPLPAEHSSVLDALIWVRRHIDPTLAFRCACRVGMCGTCGVRVNGREALACRTYLQPVLGGGPETAAIRIEPLRSLPIIQDLVTDPAPLGAAIARLSVRPRGDKPGREPVPAARAASDRGPAAEQNRDCILCGLCVSACSVAGLDPAFLGPAALVRAAIALEDRSGPGADDLLDVIGGEHGATRCHTLFECTAVCPRGVAPTAAIQRLKRRLVTRKLGRLLRLPAGSGR